MSAVQNKAKVTYNLVVDEPVPELRDCGTLAEVGRVECCKDMGRNLLGEVGHGVLFAHKRCAWG